MLRARSAGSENPAICCLRKCPDSVRQPPMMARRMPAEDMVVLSDSAPSMEHRPVVDVLFHSVSQQLDRMAVGV